MYRVFIDASVLFAALYSPSSFARDLLRLAIEKKVNLVISQNVLLSRLPTHNAWPARWHQR